MRTIDCHTDPGRNRPGNEDYVLVDEELGFAVVADGVGGLNGGDRAARAAAEQLLAALWHQKVLIGKLRTRANDAAAALLGRVVQTALTDAGSAIRKDAEADPELRGMSTTLTAFLDCGDRALIAHVGDSRAYLVRDEAVTRLTTDHVAVIEDHGRAPGELRKKRRVLTRAVGHGAATIADMTWVSLLPDDAIVLCSDGLSDVLENDSEVWEAIATLGTRAAPEVLVDLANCRGGPDNVSVVVIGPDPALVPSTQIERWEDQREHLETLRRVPAFSLVPYLDLESLRGSLQVDVFCAGDVVAPRESPASVGAILRGRARGQWPDGGSFLASEGELLGETALTSGEPWPYSVTAEDDVVLISVPAEDLSRFVAERTRASAAVLWSLLAIASERGLGVRASERSVA